MNINYSQIGARIKYFRVQRGISQEELADCTNLSRVHISYIERGERSPSLEAIISISNSLRVGLDELLQDCLFLSEDTNTSREMDALLDCTQEEAEILINAITGLKAIIRKFNISK